MPENSTETNLSRLTEARREPLDIKNVKFLFIPGNMRGPNPPKWEENAAKFFQSLGAETYYANPTPDSFLGRKDKWLPHYERILSQRDGSPFIGPNTVIECHSSGWHAARRILEHKKVLAVVAFNPYSSPLPYGPEQEDSLTKKIEKAVVAKVEKNTGFFDKHFPHSLMREGAELIVTAASEDEEIIKKEEIEHVRRMIAPKNKGDARVVNLNFPGVHYGVVDNHLEEVNQVLLTNLRDMGLVR